MADITAVTMEKQMGSLSEESFAEFLDSLKQAGIEITNEREVRERLAEVQRWRDAFTTLARNGRTIGIQFKSRDSDLNLAKIHRAFTEFKFPEQSEAQFAASLKASH
ncbi:MAG TPA: hypothetical protein VIU93_00400 [Gallionellaceae bacterium]